MTKSNEEFNFVDLVGEEFDFFYGAAEHFFKLDDTIYEAVEDGDLLEIVVSEGPKQPPFGLPIARVIVEADYGHAFILYKLVDLHDEHCWLRFGTEIHESSERSYDALAVFEYTPKDQPSHEYHS